MHKRARENRIVSEKQRETPTKKKKKTFSQGRFDARFVAAAVASAAAAALVPATVELWSALQLKMLPTPAKLHYQFTMHDLSKVFQGLLLASREGMVGGESGGGGAAAAARSAGNRNSSASSLAPVPYLAALWAHECERVFCDRMVSIEDARWVRTAIREFAAKHFGEETAAAAGLLLLPSSSSSSSGVAPPPPPALPFVDFLRDAEPEPETGELPAKRPCVYELVPASASEKEEDPNSSPSSLLSSRLRLLRQRAEQLQSLHVSNSRGAATPLVLFDDALSHLARAARVLATDRGSAVLVGVGGSGKQSLARLAAAVAGATPFQIAPSRAYGPSNFLEDMKGLFRLAGVKGQSVAFIIR